MVVVLALVFIMMGSIAVTTLVVVWIATSRSLKKRGYHRKKGQETYEQVKSSLQGVAANLSELHSQLEGVEPFLLEREFLKYARQNRTTGKQSSSS